MGNVVGGFVVECVAMLLCYVIVFTGMVPLLTSCSCERQTNLYTGIYRGGNEIKTISVYFRCNEFHSVHLVIRDAFYLLLLLLTSCFEVILIQ